MSDLAWQLEGACNADPDMWTPFDDAMRSTDHSYAWRAPRMACNGNAEAGIPACPVLAACKPWALQAPDPVPFSMAGGWTPKERARIRHTLGVVAGPKPIRHGTEAGYRAHHRRGEKPCGPCMTAATRQKREREARKTA